MAFAYDSGDPDSGANALQKFPLINAAFGLNGILTICGSLNSTASIDFVLDFSANAAPPIPWVSAKAKSFSARRP